MGFNWDNELQGHILGAFFYGYITAQILGGRLAEEFGGKYLYGLGVLCTATLSLLTPILAHTSPYLLIGSRAMEGIGEVGRMRFSALYTLRPEQSGWHFAKRHIHMWFCWRKMIIFKFHWKLFFRVQLTICQNLFHVRAWHWKSDMELSEPITTKINDVIRRRSVKYVQNVFMILMFVFIFLAILGLSHPCRPCYFVWTGVLIFIQLPQRLKWNTEEHWRINILNPLISWLNYRNKNKYDRVLCVVVGMNFI